MTEDELRAGFLTALDSLIAFYNHVVADKDRQIADLAEQLTAAQNDRSAPA
jgi:hypothetical protein